MGKINSQTIEGLFGPPGCGKTEGKSFLLSACVILLTQANFTIDKDAAGLVVVVDLRFSSNAASMFCVFVTAFHSQYLPKPIEEGAVSSLFPG